MEGDKHQNKDKGDLGEELAAKYLIDNVDIALWKKWKFMRFELDLIAEKKFSDRFCRSEAPI
jgi:Holliday junction resolvase-like predicted endonuclease